jgi:hypothetical protein
MVVLLDRDKDVYDPNGGIKRRGFSEDLDSSLGTLWVVFVNEISTVIAKGLNVVITKCIVRYWCDADLIAVRQGCRK